MWTIRSINHGKLDVAKQETARVNVDTLEISEFKWTEAGKFNSDDCYICYYGQESLRRMEEPSESIMKCSTWV